jgi:low affinity Fe/Cu permease
MKKNGDNHERLAPAPQSPLLRTGGTSVAWFTRFARWISLHAGRPTTFLIAALLVVAWALTGPLFDFSETWQLFINTGTTIVTFLMVFLIQSAQNRDSQALHLKLDELIRAKKGARNMLLDLDNLSDEQLAAIQANFAKLAAGAKSMSSRGADERAAELEVLAQRRAKL